MEGTEIERLLSRHGIKPTANRLMVANVIAQADRPLCLADIEALLDTVDKSNIFRALTLFRENRIVHTIEDETGSLHYELCQGHCHEGVDDGCDACGIEDDEDLHIHFYCRSCHQMTCLPSLHIPTVDLPEGYEAKSATFIIKGICPKCKGNK